MVNLTIKNNTMNTTAKGTKFEKRVFAVFEKMLAEQQLPFNSKNSTLFFKKKYPNSCGGMIEFDLSIEIVNPETGELAVLCPIECKDYNKNIPVEKIRNFAYQLSEVGAHKGYVVSTCGFQKGVIQIAGKERIALLKLDENETRNWICNRIVNGRIDELVQNLLEPDVKSHFAFCGYYNYEYFTDMRSLIYGVLFEQSYKGCCVPYLHENNIITEVENYIINEDEPIDYARLLSIIDSLGFTVQYQTLSNNIYAESDFKLKKVLVASFLQKDQNRLHFTLAHEIGHLVLHSDFCINNDVVSVMSDYESTYSSDDIKRIEYQANLFASHLLMPNAHFLKVYKIYHDEFIRRYYPKLHIDSQACNIESSQKLLTAVSSVFQVSKEAVKYKLKELGCLSESSHTTTIREFLRGFK